MQSQQLRLGAAVPNTSTVQIEEEDAEEEQGSSIGLD